MGAVRPGPGHPRARLYRAAGPSLGRGVVRSQALVSLEGGGGGGAAWTEPCLPFSTWIIAPRAQGCRGD